MSKLKNAGNVLSDYLKKVGADCWTGKDGCKGKDCRNCKCSSFLCYSAVPGYRWLNGSIHHEPEPMTDKRAAMEITKLLVQAVSICPPGCPANGEKCKWKSCQDHWRSYIKERWGIDVEDSTDG